jgi:5'-nucleotidase
LRNASIAQVNVDLHQQRRHERGGADIELQCEHHEAANKTHDASVLARNGEDTCVRHTWAGCALTGLLSMHAPAHADQGHSLEADLQDESAEGMQVRARASQRIRWRDPAGQRDPIVSVKLLGINDFHGQLSPRTVGPRPAGGAAVLASYLRAAAADASGAAFIIHAGDQVGASPPNSALLQAIGMLNLLTNDKCFPLRLQRALPDSLEPYAQPRCNVIGTLGNHEFDEGSAELLRLIAGGDHPTGPFLEKHGPARRSTCCSNSSGSIRIRRASSRSRA